MEQNSQTNVTVEDSQLDLRIDGPRAKIIARRFLEQLHSLIIFKDAVLEGRVWTVIMDVGHVGEHIIYVKVNAKTGTIVEVSENNLLTS